MRRALLTTMGLVSTLGLGCAHKEAPGAAEPGRPAQAAVASSRPAPGSATARAPGCERDGDCGARQLCVRNQCTDITNDAPECGSARLHFDLDSADLRDADKPVLERVARCLKADHALHVTIEGNADERGTTEYNLALGDHRATVVSRYLQLLGVSGAQLGTVSYGKEQPLCTEHDEACWSRNRRVALKAKEARR